MRKQSSGCRAREGRRHDHRRVVAMQSDSAIGQLADSEWAAFIVKLEAAEHEFALGRPAAFKALWSQGDEVSICGAFGGVQSGWEKVAARLDWASSQFSEGIRSSPDRADPFRCVRPDGTGYSRTAGDDGVSPRGGRMADRSSTRRFADEYSSCCRAPSSASCITCAIID